MDAIISNQTHLIVWSIVINLFIWVCVKAEIWSVGRSREKLYRQSYSPIMEYKTLREEIGYRIKARLIIVGFTITLAGILIGEGVREGGNNEIVLLYPVLAMFVALGWVQNNWRIRIAGAYIRRHIEKHELEKSGLSIGWETYNSKNRKDWGFTVLSHTGLFVITQVIALSVGASHYVACPVNAAIIFLDVSCIVVVLHYMTKS